MEIISVVPRGYCQGVIRAIQIAKKTVEDYPNEKITMLGMIVHNHYVVEAIEALGVQFVEDPKKTRLELLDAVDTGVVIFTAHGVSDAVKQKAKDKGLIIVDASCVDVIRTHDIVKEHIQNGHVIYLGKHHHPESEGTVSLHDNVHLVTKVEEIPDGLHTVMITTQTTLSLLDTKDLIDACMKKYPNAILHDEICNATRMRQEAIMKLENIDVLLVIGDPRSNNSLQLKEIGTKCGIPHTYLISSLLELKEDMVKGFDRIAVTGGSSTPNAFTDQVIQFLKEYSETKKWKENEHISLPVL